MRPAARRAAGVGALLALLLAVLVALGGWQRASTPTLSTNGVRTVFVGDSITHAGGGPPTSMPAERSWLRYVVTDDRTPWLFAANVAVSGERLDEMAARFQRDVLDRDPAAVVILGGTNDVLQRVPVEDALPQLERMISMALLAGLEVWVIAPPPIEGRGVDAQPLRRAARVLAEQSGVTWVDPVDAVGSAGRWGPGMSRDGVHPTERGARAWADGVLDRVAARPAGQ